MGWAEMAPGPPCRRCAGTGIDPLGPPAARQSPPKRATPKNCLHPPGRRIGESCAACGAKVGKPDRRYGR